MSKEHDGKFVYVTFIASTPAKVWQALLEGEITRQYWGGNQNVATSGWKEGAEWQHVAGSSSNCGSGHEDTPVRVVGKVLEFIPEKRLALSWASPSEASDQSLTSRVVLDIETVGDNVQLTVTHDRLHEDMQRRISGGWPRVLSSLKSYLETGRPLAIFG